MKKILLLVAFVAAAGSAAAQEGLSKQLEVTRAYTPRVARAQKLPIAPDMTDTVRLRPEVSYTITSTASPTSFTTRPYEAARLEMASFDAARSLYLRAGVGAPLATRADVYFTPRMRAGRTFGIFANHAGDYSKIRNDIGFKASAVEMTNAAGLWGSRRWKRYSIEGNLTYDHRLQAAYGAVDINPDPASSESFTRKFDYSPIDDRFSLGYARGDVSFGDDFTDLSHFNFRIGADGGYAHGGGKDLIKVNARVVAAKMFGEGKHGFEIELTERWASDLLEPDDVGLLTVALSPRYLLRTGTLSLEAGFDERYVENHLHGQKYIRFAPHFKASLNLAEGTFVPFMSYTSHTLEGDFESLSRRNPYIDWWGSTAWINDARIGFSGDVNDIFSYKLSGGLSTFTDYQLMIGMQSISRRKGENGEAVQRYSPLWFLPLAVSGTRFTAGAEVGVHNLGGFGARLWGDWNGFDFSSEYSYQSAYTFTPVGDLPEWDAGMELSYGHGDKFSVRLGAELIGPRSYLVDVGSPDRLYGIDYAYPTTSLGVYTHTIEPAVDLSLGVDARVTQGFGVFVEGKNLAGQKLYPYPGYVGRGASVVAGVKIVF